MRDALDRPNIILINCDDLRFGDLSCYGSKVNDTPALDRMAADGVRFTDFYMASPVCSPSRGAMMTGSYPPRIGFEDFDGKHVLFPGQGLGLNPDEQTVASLLRDAGYATAHIGKWHCGDQPEFLPTRHGFDTYYGIPYSNDMGKQRAGGDLLPPLPLLSDEQVIAVQPQQESITERYVERSLEFMRQNADRPFFLYLAHMYVHIPLYVPDAFERQSRNGPYGAAVRCIDWSTQALLTELKRLGLSENTLIVFTSDNGARCTHGGSNGALRGTKGTTWEGGQRVPCIAYWPGTIPGGRTSSELASSIDLLPTFVRLAGGESPRQPIDGLDLSDHLLGRSKQGPREEFVYYYCHQLEGIRDRRFKLRVAREDQAKPQLYDLSEDPGEHQDIADREPGHVARLEKRLDEYRQKLGDSWTGVAGRERRPIGRVDQPRPLVGPDEDDYLSFIAEYDLADRG